MTNPVLDPAAAKTATEEKRAPVDQLAESVLAELYEKKPLAKDQIKKAAGYAVFPNVGIKVVLASFAGGHGVVVDRNSGSADLCTYPRTPTLLLTPSVYEYGEQPGVISSIDKRDRHETRAERSARHLKLIVKLECVPGILPAEEAMM